MQPLKIRQDLIYVLNPILFIVGMLLFFYFPTAIHLFFHVFWVAVIAALFFIITKYGNTRLAHNHDDQAIRLPPLFWIACIIIMELAFFGVYHSIVFLCDQALPINMATAHAKLFSSTLSSQLLSDGLFPWSLYAVITVGMGFVAYCQQNNVYFNTLLEPLTHQGPQETLGVIINTGIRRCTTLAISVTLMFGTLLIISILFPAHVNSPFGFQPSALFATLILFFLSMSKIAKRMVARVFMRHIPTAIGFPVFCVCLALLILLITAVGGSLAQRVGAQSTPHFIHSWIHMPWLFSWHIFADMWCATLAPLMCIFFTRISRGYRIRDVIIAILALPLCLSIYFMLAHDYAWPALSISHHASLIIALMSFLIFLPLLLTQRHSYCAIIAYFPKNGEGKPRDHQPFFYKIAQTTVIGLYFYLVIGVNGLSLMFFAINFWVLLTLLFAVPAIIKNYLSSPAP